MPWTVCVYGWWGNLLVDSCFQKLVPTLMAQLVKNLPAMQETCKRHGFDPWVRQIPWRGKWQPTLEFLSGKSQGQTTRQATVYGVVRV